MPSEKPRDHRLLIIRVLVFATLGALLLAYGLSQSLRETLNTGVILLASGNLEELREWGHGLGAWAPLATLFLMVAQAVAAPIPAVLVTATNSFLFGPFWGGVYSIFSATLAASFCYGISRWLGDLILDRLISQAKMRKSEEFLEKHGVAAILVARLLPFVPFDPISYAAGMARMRFWPFFWATFLGQIPAGMTYSYLAQQVNNPSALLLNGIGAVLVLAVIGWWARRRLLGRGG